MSHDGECDPRVARSKAAILDATMELIGERGVADVTIEAIAERSGCAKTTIYRHWPSRTPLLVEVLETITAFEHDPFTGDAVGDCVKALRAMRDRYSEPGYRRATIALLAEVDRDEDFKLLFDRFRLTRRAIMREVLLAGVADGSLAGAMDIEETLDLLMAPVFYRSLTKRSLYTDEALEQITRRILGV